MLKTVFMLFACISIASADIEGLRTVFDRSNSADGAGNIINEQNQIPKADGAGNGGGAWICRDRESDEILWSQVIDLYEAENEFGLQLKYTVDEDYFDILIDVINRIEVINSELYSEISPYFSEFISATSNVKFKDHVEIVDDVLFREKPQEVNYCINGRIEYMQLINFSDDNQMQLNSFITNLKFSSLDRAALVIHEVVYLYLRDKSDDLSSIRTRRITGLLFSNKDNQELDLEIQRILSTNNIIEILK